MCLCTLIPFLQKNDRHFVVLYFQLWNDICCALNYVAHTLKVSYEATLTLVVDVLLRNGKTQLEGQSTAVWEPASGGLVTGLP